MSYVPKNGSCVFCCEKGFGNFWGQRYCLISQERCYDWDSDKCESYQYTSLRPASLTENEWKKVFRKAETSGRQ